MYVRTSAFLVALALAVSGLAGAQETTGTVTGRVVDAQGLAVPGATVTLTGPQGPRSVVTDGDGRFSSPFLTPGTYMVRAELQGFKAAEARNIVISLDTTTTINLKMEVGGLTETVEVIGAAATIDTKTTTIGGVLDSEMLSLVPIGRRMTDALYLVPGVSSGGAVGRANPSISGASGLDNQYIVDGVNVTNTGYGAIGSYSIIFGSLGTATPFDFIKELQVKSGGYEAEYGQAMGGLVNVVTKSGSNQLRGSIFGYTRPDALESPWRTVQTPNGVVNTVGSETSDVGAEAGGPVLRDRLFFFGAIDPTWETRTFIAPDGFPLQSLGQVDRKRTLWSYSAKATWQAASAHSVNASFFGDPSHGDMGPQRQSAMLVSDTSSFSEIDYGGNSQTVRYDGVISSNWLIEGSFAHSTNKINETPSVNQWRFTDTRVTPQVITGGIGFFEQGNNSGNYQYAAKSTNVLGDHQLKYGVLYEDVKYIQASNRTGPTFTIDGRETATGATVSILPDVNFGQIYRVTRANFNIERVTHQDYWAFFVQDNWRVGDRLTINPGLRYEQQTLIGTIQQLQTIDGESLDNFPLKNNWAPRIGVVYDVIGNGRSKLYFNYGRFFARVPNDLAARALSADEGVSRADFFDANLSQQVPEGVLTVTPGGVSATQHVIVAGAAPDLIDPDTKLSSKDEYVAGFEWEAIPNNVFGVRYIHRGIGKILEDVAPAPAVACDAGFVEACSVDYVLTNPNPGIPTIPASLGASFENPIHDYDAVEVTYERRFLNNWMVNTSYRWSRLYGTYEGFFRDDNGQSDPGITSLYDFPTNDPSYTAIGGTEFGYQGNIQYLGALGAGPLPLDRPNAFKFFGNYAFPFGLSLGLGYYATSGKPLTALAALPPYDNDSEIPLTPRGGGFETVDGFKTRTPWEHQWDLQASYQFNMAGNRRLTLIADLFNVLNFRRVTDYNAAVEYPSFGAENPDFGTVTNANVQGQMYQAPFQLRLGARFQF